MTSHELRTNLEHAIFLLRDRNDEKPIRQLCFQLFHEAQEAKEKTPQIIERTVFPKEKEHDYQNTIKQLNERISLQKKTIITAEDQLTHAMRRLHEFEMQHFKPLNIYKEINTKQLLELAIRSVELHFDHVPSREFFSKLDDDGRHIAGMVFLHSPCYHFWHDNKIQHKYNFGHNNGFNIRADVFCKMRGTDKPESVIMDFDEEMFMQLPTIEIKKK